MNVLSDVPLALWQRISENCPYSTFFHGPVWADILSKTFPCLKIATRAFGFENDEWVILPMMESRDDLKGFFKSYHSSILGVYGGFISNGVLNQERVNVILQHLQTARIQKIFIFGNPFSTMELSLSGWSSTPDFTHVIKLQQFSNEEELMKSYTKNLRKDVERAIRQGYTVRKADNEYDVKCYYEIYQQALDRYGNRATGRQSLDLFMNVVNQRSPQAGLWLAEIDGRTEGGMVCFNSKKHWVAWHAAFLSDGLSSGVAKFLHHKMLAHAYQQGFHYYDFNPSGGHKGTAIFKERFNAERRSFNVYLWEGNRLYSMYKALKATPFSRFFPANMRLAEANHV